LDGNEGIPSPEPHSEKESRNCGVHRLFPSRLAELGIDASMQPLHATEDIWKIEPEMTVIRGEIVYTRQVQARK
jgi:hypothetical protein